MDHIHTFYQLMVQKNIKNKNLTKKKFFKEFKLFSLIKKLHSKIKEE